MAAKPYKPGDNVTVVLYKDEVIWDNTEGTKDCKVTKCQPALEKDTYIIPKGEAVAAKPAHKTSALGQDYHSDCAATGAVANPKLIVQ